MYRLRLTFDQLSLLSAITKSDALKRVMIEATTVLPPNTVVRAHDLTMRVGEPLGSGLVGTVYTAYSLDGRATYAYKRARAPFSFFRESLRIEQRAAAALAQLSALRPVEIITADTHSLVKACCRHQTLADLLVAGEVSARQRDTLVAALKEAAEIERSLGFIIDLSPKNLCWDNGWLLLDTGPKIHVTDFCAVLAEPSWHNYFNYVREKLARQPGRSAPSVLTRACGDDSAKARRYAFLREWWRWFPYDEQVDTNYFFADIDNEQCEDEVLYRLEPTSQSGIMPADSGDPRLVHNPLVRAAATASWQRQYPHLAVNTDINESVDEADTGPITLAELAGELLPLGLAGALQTAVKTKRRVKPPTLTVNAYQHWTDLARPASGHRPWDIFCQEPLLPPNITCQGLLNGHYQFTAAPPWKADDGRFCRLTCTTNGDGRRALLFVPGFRADARAALPLVSALMDRGVEGFYALAYIGFENMRGQALVTAGRWETILLWSAVDYLTACMGAREVVIIAASHGALAATIVTQWHPLVSALALDSAVVRPYEIVNYLAGAQGESYEELLSALADHHLPPPYLAQPPTRKGVKMLTLRPYSDRLLDICGHLGYGESICYDGGHAATMRHDSFDRTIPSVCIDALCQFLQ